MERILLPRFVFTTEMEYKSFPEKLSLVSDLIATTSQAD